MKNPPELTTKRLFLKGICESDTSAIVSWRSDPSVYRFFLFPHRIDEDEHKKWFYNSYLNNENRIDWIAFDYSGKRVGVFGVKRDNKSSDTAEISYLLDPDEYGKGYATESVTELIAFCKDNWKVKIIVAEIHKDNLNSIKLVKKLGFYEEKEEGIFLHFSKCV